MSYSDRISRHPMALLVGILLLATFVRVIDIQDPSIWIDELITSNRAQLDLQAMVSSLSAVQQPLYYAIVQLWNQLVGSTLFSMRYLSALFGVLSIALVYRLSATIFDKKTGLISATVIAISAFFVFYSRMARGYPLLWFLILLSAWCFLKAIQSDKLIYWFAYTITSLIAIYTHFTSYSILLFFGLFFLFYWRKFGVTGRRWIISNLLIALGVIPTIARLFYMVFDSDGTPSRDLLSPIWSLSNIFVAWNIGDVFPTTKITVIVITASFGIIALAGVFDAVFSISLPSLHGYRISFENSLADARLTLDQRGLFLVGIIVFPILFAFVALVFNSNLPISPRSLSLAGLGYMIIFSRGVLQMQKRSIGVILIGLCFVLSMVSLVMVRRMNAGIDWKSLAALIEASTVENEAIFVNPSEYLPGFAWYYEGSGKLVGGQTSSGSSQTQQVLSLMSDTLVGMERIWAIKINDSEFDPSGQIDKWLSNHCSLAEEVVLIPSHAGLGRYEECQW